MSMLIEIGVTVMAVLNCIALLVNLVFLVYRWVITEEIVKTLKQA